MDRAGSEPRSACPQRSGDSSAGRFGCSEPLQCAFLRDSYRGAVNGFPFRQHRLGDR